MRPSPTTSSAPSSTVLMRFSCPRGLAWSPVTLPTGADEAGEPPPPQVLRTTGQPRRRARSTLADVLNRSRAERHAKLARLRDGHDATRSDEAKSNGWH